MIEINLAKPKGPCWFIKLGADIIITQCVQEFMQEFIRKSMKSSKEFKKYLKARERESD